MSVPSDVLIHKAGLWLVHAGEDLVLARHALKLKSSCPYRLIAYHAQQCVEKSLKAFLVLQDVDFPYTHNLFRLVGMCPKDVSWLASAMEAASLTPYAATTRYPGGELDVTRDEAVAAAGTAAVLTDLIRRDILERVERLRGKEGIAILDLGPNIRSRRRGDSS